MAALNALGANADETVYVGDSVNDARAAEAAGVRFAAALWAKSESERTRFVEMVTAEGVWELLPEPAALVRLLNGAEL